MGTLLIIFLSILMRIYGEFTGEHVCEMEESYKVNVTKYESKNVTVRTYKWCLHVPPRCSEYVMKEVNETKYVLEDRVRRINKCCNGYVEDESGTSCINTTRITQCQNCTHGDCHYDNDTCLCHSGFYGYDCTQECNSDKWGVNCINNCTCLRGKCNPITGECLCPQGWFGKMCDIRCPIGDGSNLNPDIDKYCNNFILNKDYFTTTKSLPYGKSKNKLMKPYLQKYHTFASITKTINIANPINIKELDTTTKDITTTENVEYVPTKTTIFTPSITTTSTSTTTTSASPKTTATTTVITTTFTRTTAITTPRILTKYKDVEEHQEVEKLNYLKDSKRINNNNNTLENQLEREWSNDDSSNTANVNENVKTSSANNKYIMLITIISIIVIVTIIVIITLTRLLRRNGVDAISKVEKNIDKTTVSVYTKSIFHTPLPDPPVFENPVFTTPIVNNSKKSMETHVVCNIHFPKNNGNRHDDEELFYDHPPSTGSYRAASIPEPPKIYEITPMEPLYDEIPCCVSAKNNLLPYNKNTPSSIYMNTNNAIT